MISFDRNSNLCSVCNGCFLKCFECRDSGCSCRIPVFPECALGPSVRRMVSHCVASHPVRSFFELEDENTTKRPLRVISVSGVAPPMHSLTTQNCAATVLTPSLHTTLHCPDVTLSTGISMSFAAGRRGSNFFSQHR